MKKTMFAVIFSIAVCIIGLIIFFTSVATFPNPNQYSISLNIADNTDIKIIPESEELEYTVTVVDDQKFCLGDNNHKVAVWRENDPNCSVLETDPLGSGEDKYVVRLQRSAENRFHIYQGYRNLVEDTDTPVFMVDAAEGSGTFSYQEYYSIHNIAMKAVIILMIIVGIVSLIWLIESQLGLLL